MGIIHTRGQYIRSHSTGEDFISLIVAVSLNKQLTAVWLKFGVLDFRRKRLTGVGSTLTFVENDQGVGLPWHSSERTLFSHHSFLQHQFIAWLDRSFVFILCNRTLGLFAFWTLVLERVTFLTTSRFADSHRVAIGLHATGFVSLCISLAKYFFNILFCNHNYFSIIVYLLIATDTQSKLNCSYKS